MESLPPFITARDLLNQVVDSLQVKPEQSRLEQPCDCEYMSLLSDTSNHFSLQLVNGADYLNWVIKYAFYYSTGLEMETAVVCLESRPLTNLLALVSVRSGIPQSDLFSLCVCRQHFEVLNRALEELYVANPLFFESSRIDLDGLIALIRHLKKHEGVEVVIVDALHQVRLDGSKPTTSTEQSHISSILKSTANVGRLNIVAGFYDPEAKFPNLPADSVLYCDSGQSESTKAEPKRIAIASLAIAKIGWIRKACRSLFRRIVPLIKQD
jgi:hypothetical protein